MNHQFKTTNRIVDALEKHKIKFEVEIVDEMEWISVGFAVEGGPVARLNFVCEEDGPVAARIFDLATSVPDERRGRLLEAINILNCKFRYVRFFLDDDNDLNVQYDFPKKISDESVGEAAFEVVVRVMDILDKAYGTIGKALYTDEDLTPAGE